MLEEQLEGEGEQVGAGLAAGDLELRLPDKRERLEFLEDRAFKVCQTSAGFLAYKLHGDPEANAKLLLIPGIGACGHYLDALIALLLSKDGLDFTIATFDPRGSGQSSMPDGRFTTSRMALDCKDLLDHLGWERAHIIGNSLGGMVAQELCLLEPTRIASVCFVVTCNRGTGCASASGLSIIVKNAFEKKLDKKLANLMKLQFSTAVTDDPESTKYKRLYDALAERTRTVGETGANSLGGLLSLAYATQTHSVSAVSLRKITEFRIPRIVIGSTEDKLVSISRQQTLAKALDCEYVQLDGGHSILDENPAAFIDCFSKFVTPVLSQ